MDMEDNAFVETFVRNRLWQHHPDLAERVTSLEFAMGIYGPLVFEDGSCFRYHGAAFALTSDTYEPTSDSLRSMWATTGHLLDLPSYPYNLRLMDRRLFTDPHLAIKFHLYCDVRDSLDIPFIKAHQEYLTDLLRIPADLLKYSVQE